MNEKTKDLENEIARLFGHVRDFKNEITELKKEIERLQTDSMTVFNHINNVPKKLPKEIYFTKTILSLIEEQKQKGNHKLMLNGTKLSQDVIYELGEKNYDVSIGNGFNIMITWDEETKTEHLLEDLFQKAKIDVPAILYDKHIYKIIYSKIVIQMIDLFLSNKNFNVVTTVDNLRKEAKSYLESL